jgi:hypothetical protein
VHALERALVWRPGSFVPLLHLTRAYIRRRELYRAHRALAQARESDPERFARVAPIWLAREGVDLHSLSRVLGTVAAGQPNACAPAATALRTPGPVRASSLPYGDCRDLDEYAHFQAMPPISEAERESVDWDNLLADLLEE